MGNSSSRSSHEANREEEREKKQHIHMVDAPLEVPREDGAYGGSVKVAPLPSGRELGSRCPVGALARIDPFNDAIDRPVDRSSEPGNTEVASRRQRRRSEPVIELQAHPRPASDACREGGSTWAYLKTTHLTTETGRKTARAPWPPPHPRVCEINVTTHGSSLAWVAEASLDLASRVLGPRSSRRARRGRGTTAP
jgi:hypothetical protein